MAKVTKLELRKHVYELDHCAGCGSVIDGEYMELGIPTGDSDRVKRIALCNRCTGSAKKEGVI